MDSNLWNLEKDKQHLFYFGAEHSRNPEDKQFTEIENYWNDFLKRTDGKNKIVFIESGVKEIYKDKAEAVKKQGEVGFTAFLAQKNNIEHICSEPNLFTEREKLLKKFSKEESQYYYFARAVDSWNRFAFSVPFLEYITPYLERDRTVTEWDDFDFSIDHMRQIHKEIFHDEFNERNKDFFAKLVNPFSEETIINKIARESGYIRDSHIVRKIIEAWEQGKNIFVVYGLGHLNNHKTMLEKKLLENT